MPDKWANASRDRLEEARRVITNELRNAMSRITQKTSRILGDVIDNAHDALNDVDQAISEG